MLLFRFGAYVFVNWNISMPSNLMMIETKCVHKTIQEMIYDVRGF